MSSNKRSAGSPADHAESAALSARLDSQTTAGAESAVATSPAAAAAPPPSLSPAQRCAADTVAAVYSFLDLAEMLSAAYSCRAWYEAAGRGESRELLCQSNDQLASLLAGRSPLRRHVGDVELKLNAQGVELLAQLHTLPALTGLNIDVAGGVLPRLLKQRGYDQAATDLRAAFPPRVTVLFMSFEEGAPLAVVQLLLDALPAMEQLRELFFHCDDSGQPLGAAYSSLSLEPLLQLPHLDALSWSIGSLAEPQLQAIKQMHQLQTLFGNGHQVKGSRARGRELLAALCRPPHRLQQLQFLSLENTVLGAEEMAELVHLPGLNSLFAHKILPAAFPFLPRLPLLEELSLHLSDLAADLSAAQHAAIHASLRACPALTKLAFRARDPDLEEPCVLTEEVGARLVKCVPKLRELRLSGLQLPSLHFLRLAPQLTQLDLVGCSQLASSHIMALSWWAPVLVRLCVRWCPGLRLDVFALQLLTPPSLALPRLQQLAFDAGSG